VLSKEDNEALCRVGPGTLMGNLLRRYWTPAMLASELPEPGGAPVKVRLLGEDLVAFVDDEGKVGLVDQHCPHRGASLYFGRNEDCSLRCVYHGWAFDTEGNCTDMPSEPRPFADRIKLTAYPVKVSGGIVWTYMGPKESMTDFRDFGTETLPEGSIYANKEWSSANWVQAMEGNIDTAHISHLHQFNGIDDIPDDGTDEPGYPSNAQSWKFWRHDRAPRLEVEDTWYGYRYAGIRTTPNGHTHVRITAFAVPYSTIVAGVPFTSGNGMFVPIDDENCYRYFFSSQPYSNPRNLGGANLFDVAPYTTPFMNPDGGEIPRDLIAANDYGIDRILQRTSTFSGISDFVSQDLMVTESMGPIYDRSKEHLGSTDASIIRMRNILLNAARGLAEGKRPPALAGDGDFRDVLGAEKILAPGEDWRTVGTPTDPVVQEARGELLAD
jgi:phthalate 4,5-dioxygenase